ncbi:MAG: ADP-ribosylglycohydrolase family protein [bacterium]|nr:ADP-ribosylglycohydrolase family protein [bacterium]
MVDDRARGLMVGLAVGNLLGITTEGRPRSSIARAFPGGVEDIVARPGFPDDDDLAQAIVIAEAATVGDGLDIDDLGRRFWHWAEVNGAGMGRLTGAVLSLYGGAYPQRLARNRLSGKPRQPDGMPIIEASRKGWKGGRAGNGALMRTAPLSILWRDARDRLVCESVVSAVPTHWDVRCGWSCAVANLVTAAALTGTTLGPDMLMSEAEAGMAASLPRLEAYGYDMRAPHSVADAVDEASVSTLDDLRFDGHDMGYTLLSLQAALISCWRAEDFEQGLRQVIEAGGDTDTNGAIAGAVLGARFGLEGIPERWRRREAEIRAGRIRMEDCADGLVVAASERAPLTS